ncbi:MAG: dienelactone hydrolase family protein [Pseudomonadota bacterium]|nr:dienelactone hydrolase family protein [Pseudomonadota bacterium]
MAASMIDGSRLAPASGGAAKSLVVFLHGYGADGNDLIGLGQHWARAFPDTAFVSPHAPEPCAMSPMGRQWFPLTLRDPSESWRGVQQAGPGLDAFLDAEMERHGLGDDRLALVGFSQGTMMALHVGLRRAKAPAGIVGYSGAIAGAEHLDAQLRSKPPVLLVHGDADEVIPIDALHMTREALAAASVPVQWHVSEGIGHGIDNDGLTIGAQFLSQVLAGPALL